MTSESIGRMEKPARADLPPALALRLQALDKQFRAGLRQRLADAGSPDLAAASAALHRLVGAAGIYGHEALSRQARQAMESLAEGRDAEHASAMQLLTLEIDKLLD